MSKLRSVSTAFWSDPFVEELTPTEKLLFLYLVTNEKTNMLGIYEASISKMSFETGIDKKTLSKALERFETVGKVKYINNFVFLTNYLKHQNFNPNMKKSAIDVFNNLPKGLVDNDLEISKVNPSEGFERLSKALGMVRKVEVEEEVETEVEIETKKEQGTTKIDSNKLLSVFNSILGKGARLITDKANKQLTAALKAGYSKDDIVKAITNASKDPHHIDSKYKYLTLEFITRPDKLDRFINMSDFTIKSKMI
ncbi:MAG: hypothetical protein ACI9M3_001376 [Bacteroidia bacterium]|jgi:hypothetical protein